MLSQKEVYDIMEKDFLELQRKRIAELEEALFQATEIISKHVHGSGATVIQNKKLIEKGISL